MPITFDGYRPGVIAAALGLHMEYYGREWGFGLVFETGLASGLAEFLTRFEAERDLFLTAWRDDHLVGMIALDVSDGGLDGSELRWFMVSAGERGTGLGKQMMARAISHADSVSAGAVWLTTFAGLDAAKALYERFGFDLISQSETDQWQGGVIEQAYLRPAPAMFAGEF